MGLDKLFSKLAGRKVIAHSIAAFEDSPQVREIILVAREDRIPAMQEMVDAEKFTKVRQIIAGGAERHLSVWNGLCAVSGKSDYIAIHDGARPLTTPKLIRKCLKLAREYGAACCAAPIPDTIKRASEEQMVSGSVERAGLWAMQTPQIFGSGLILQAYAAVIAKNEPVTDEVSAVQRLGKKIALLRNDDWNFKITFPKDLEMAEHVLAVGRNRSVELPKKLPRKKSQVT